jgi:hypothetical protein
MSTQLTGRTVRILIGPEPKNHVTRDMPEVKVSFEGVGGAAGRHPPRGQGEGGAATSRDVLPARRHRGPDGVKS